MRPTTNGYHPRSSEVPIDPRLLPRSSPLNDGKASPNSVDDEGGYEEEEGDDMETRETQIILQRITQQGIDVRRIATAVDRLQVQMQVLSKSLEDLKNGKANASTNGMSVEGLGQENDQLRKTLDFMTSEIGSMGEDQPGAATIHSARRSAMVDAVGETETQSRRRRSTKSKDVEVNLITRNYPPRDRRPAGSQRLSSGFPRKAPWKEGTAPGPNVHGTKRKIEEEQQVGPSKRSSSLRNELRPKIGNRDDVDGNGDIEFVSNEDHEANTAQQENIENRGHREKSQSLGSPVNLDLELRQPNDVTTSENPSTMRWVEELNNTANKQVNAETPGSSPLPALKDFLPRSAVDPSLEQDAGVDLTEDVQGAEPGRLPEVDQVRVDTAAKDASHDSLPSKAHHEYTVTNKTSKANANPKALPRKNNGRYSKNSTPKRQSKQAADPVLVNESTSIAPQGSEAPTSTPRTRAASLRLHELEDFPKQSENQSEAPVAVSPSAPAKRMSTRSKSGVSKPTPKSSVSNVSTRKIRQSLPAKTVRKANTRQSLPANMGRKNKDDPPLPTHATAPRTSISSAASKNDTITVIEISASSDAAAGDTDMPDDPASHLQTLNNNVSTSNNNNDYRLTPSTEVTLFRVMNFPPQSQTETQSRSRTHTPNPYINGNHGHSPPRHFPTLPAAAASSSKATEDEIRNAQQSLQESAAPNTTVTNADAGTVTDKEEMGVDSGTTDRKGNGKQADKGKGKQKETLSTADLDRLVRETMEREEGMLDDAF